MMNLRVEDNLNTAFAVGRGWLQQLQYQVYIRFIYVKD